MDEEEWEEEEDADKLFIDDSDDGKYVFECRLLFNAYSSLRKYIFLGCGRGGRPTTSISSPSHILLIFSSEPPRNPRPSIIMCLKVSNSLR